MVLQIAFLIIYQLSEVFTWHFCLQALLSNSDTCQGPRSTETTSPSCHCPSRSTRHPPCFTHCSSYFHTRSSYSLPLPGHPQTILLNS